MSNALSFIGASLLFGGVISTLSGGNAPAPTPPKDSVGVACEEYEKSFREVSVRTADKLDSGELSTDRESRDYRSRELSAAMKAAFLPLAAVEAGKMSEGWTAEVESSILRGYSNDVEQQ